MEIDCLDYENELEVNSGNKKKKLIIILDRVMQDQKSFTLHIVI